MEYNYNGEVKSIIKYINGDKHEKIDENSILEKNENKKNMENNEIEVINNDINFELINLNGNKEIIEKNKDIQKNEGNNIIYINLYREIKSKYNIKKIFSFLDINKKLKIIVYNKKYQEFFNINIDYYKRRKGKYTIDLKNGKKREYEIYTNKLLFEGEYKNGKRNGKGKE